MNLSRQNLNIFDSIYLYREPLECCPNYRIVGTSCVGNSYKNYLNKSHYINYVADKCYVYIYITSIPSQECWPGSRGVNCAEDCEQGFYGRFCREKCLCDPCDKVKGCKNITREYIYNRVAFNAISLLKNQMEKQTIS